MDPTHPVLDDEEVAICARALDVHRQSLVNKVNHRLGPNDVAERQRTLHEVELCSTASAKMKAAESHRLGVAR